MTKTVAPLLARIDEIALSVVGWQVQDFQARLVTDKYDDSHFHSLAVSASLQFLPEDWTDRFRHFGYPSNPVIRVLCPRVSEFPTYYELLCPEIKKIRGPLRLSEKGFILTDAGPLAPEDVQVTLTAFDGIDIGYHVEPLPTAVTALPTSLMDETSWPGLKLILQEIESFSSKGTGKVHIRVSGVAEVGTLNELLSAYLVKRDYGHEVEIADACPFEVSLPELRCEVLDTDGFILKQFETSMNMQIRVANESDRVQRQPRWLVDRQFDIDDLAGEPDHVVVRVVDGDA